MCAADSAEQAAAGRDLRRRPQSPGAAAGDTAGLMVPPQLQRGQHQQVGGAAVAVLEHVFELVYNVLLCVCVSAGATLTSLCPSTAWTRSSPNCSPSRSSDSWRSSASTKVESQSPFLEAALKNLNYVSRLFVFEQNFVPTLCSRGDGMP